MTGWERPSAPAAMRAFTASTIPISAALYIQKGVIKNNSNTNLINIINQFFYYVNKRVLAPAGAIFTIKPASAPNVVNDSRNEEPAAKIVRSSAWRVALNLSFSSVKIIKKQ